MVWTRPFLQRLGFEGEPSLGKESLDEGGPVLDALEPVPDDDGELVHVAGGELPRPFFMSGQMPSAGLP